MSENQPPVMSETEDLTRKLFALCTGYDAHVIAFALSTVLAELLIRNTQYAKETMRGSVLRKRGALKRHHLKQVAAMLEPLDEVP